MIRAQRDAVLLDVAARPGANRSAIQGTHGEALKVAIRAPPEKGKANKELIAFLAKTLGLKRSRLTLHAGRTSRSKTIRVEGMGEEELRKKLAEYISP